MALKELTPLRIISEPPPTAPLDGRANVEIYRPFFIAGILSVLTAGCTLGAIALLGIALKGSYTASVWTPYVLAHANSQLYGWVGFFVMGFALQQHAPRQSRVRLFHKLAYWSLGLMAVGIGLRFAAEPLAGTGAGWLNVGVASCVLQVAAILLFNLNTALTRFKSGQALTWQTNFVYASLAWWLVVAIAEPFYFYSSHTRGVQFVAEWFPPYREAQFLGFVAMMIFGVALVKLNSCFAAKRPMQLLGEAGFVLWNASLLARMAGWLVTFRSGFTADSSWMYRLGGFGLAAAAVLLVIATRIFERVEEPLPSHKFIRAAMTWLLVAGVLFALEPLHLAQFGMPFSHAYTGAIRHAVTVGFISQMILGVGSHVVARMNDLDVQPALWSVFWLVNIGNTLRVSFEIATDYAPGAFLPMGATGFIELTGLVIWATAVVVPMLKRRIAHVH